MALRRNVRRPDAPLYIEDETEEFSAALRRCSASAVEELLAAVSPEDAEAWTRGPLDDEGHTALHQVLEAPNEAQLRLVRLLCARRADANAAAAGGVTPLHLAAHHGSKYTLRALLCAGGDNLRRTDDGRTTVDFAQCNPSPIEAFEVVGWPGQGPHPEPLTAHRTQRAAAEAAEPQVPNTGADKDPPGGSKEGEGDGSGWNSKGEDNAGYAMLMAAAWFAFLGFAATTAIRFFI